MYVTLYLHKFIHASFLLSSTCIKTINNVNKVFWSTATNKLYFLQSGFKQAIGHFIPELTFFMGYTIGNIFY